MKEHVLKNEEQIFGVSKKEENHKFSNTKLVRRVGSSIFYIPQKNNLMEIKGRRKRLHMCNMIFREGRWDLEEHKLFIKSCLIHGNNWKKVQIDVKTRSAAQIRSHAQKFLLRLKRKYNNKFRRDNCPNSLIRQLKPEMCEEEKKFLEKLKITNLDEFEIEENPNHNSQGKKRNKHFIKRIIINKQMNDIMKPSRKIFIVNKVPRLKSVNLEDVKNIVSDMIIHNDCVMAKLLQNNQIENDYQNAVSWINSNKEIYNAQSEFEKFIFNMNNILNGWKHFPIFDQNIEGKVIREKDDK